MLAWHPGGREEVVAGSWDPSPFAKLLEVIIEDFLKHINSPVGIELGIG